MASDAAIVTWYLSALSHIFHYAIVVLCYYGARVKMDNWESGTTRRRRHAIQGGYANQASISPGMMGSYGNQGAMQGGYPNPQIGQGGSGRGQHGVGQSGGAPYLGH
ncbi:unnamed protein product [Prunus armeniaca]|uniref:Uncharacterized protein n=1 Tax=Prunus armeniaca TaxID=36596 RepID=A0A6J5XAE0_PRUAR|nr:unnamed protein product [Prunus armeniaca]